MMNHFKCAHVLLFSLLFFSVMLPVNGYADSEKEETDYIELVFQVGLSFGGDTIQKVPYVDDTGNPSGHSNINAGEKLYISGGLVFKTLPTVVDWLETQVTIGYWADTASDRTENRSDLKWRRTPVEALQFVKFKRFRIGGGVTWHLNPELKGSGSVSQVNVEADDETGFVVETDYFFYKKAYVSIKYTDIEYEIAGKAFDGSNTAFILGFKY